MPPESSLTPTDGEILRRTAAGDRSAFETLMVRHEAAVLRLVRSLCGDPARAEDALQETFIAAWRAAAGFRGEDSARGWLLGIARHAVHRQYRRHAGEPSEHLSLQDLGLDAGWGEDPRDAPEKRLEDRDLVEKGFRGLAPEDQEILILRDLEGFSAEQVARVLGLSLAAAKSRLHRARLRFMGNLRRGLHAGT